MSAQQAHKVRAHRVDGGVAASVRIGFLVAFRAPLRHLCYKICEFPCPRMHASIICWHNEGMVVLLRQVLGNRLSGSLPRFFQNISSLETLLIGKLKAFSRETESCIGAGMNRFSGSITVDVFGKLQLIKNFEISQNKGLDFDLELLNCWPNLQNALLEVRNSQCF